MVQKSLPDHLPHMLPQKKSKSNWERFAEQFKDVMILILLAAAAVSFFISESVFAFYR